MSDNKEIPDIAPNLTPNNNQNGAAPADKPKNNGRRNKITGYFVLFFCLAGLIAFAIWWFVFRNHETTDDAYVGGNMVVLTARQMGSVVAYYADDTDFVQEGQILVELDPIDYILAFDHSRSALEIAAREVREQYEEVKERQADVAVKRAEYRKTWIDFKNRMALVGSEAISREDYDHALADFRVAKASLNLSKHQLESAIAKLGVQELHKHPRIEKARSDMYEAYLGIIRCTIRAPVSGYIGKRSVQAGQSIKSSTPLLSIIPLGGVWVDANFKETQLKHMRIGQPVEVTADMYGGKVVYHGKVGGLQPGSGSVFSLLPPQNASGNWIKIVQRVPVRIYLDPEEVKNNPLLLGLSVYAKVDILDRSGPQLAGPMSALEPLMKTQVFDIPLEGIGKVMDELVNANLGSR